MIDRMPRIRLILIATFFMCCALLVQSILSAVYAGKQNASVNALNAQVAMFFVFNLFFVAVGYVLPLPCH